LGVNRVKFSARLQRIEKVCLDTVVLIYHLEGVAPYVDLTEEVITRIASGRLKAVISSVTLMELIVKPFMDGRLHRVAEIEDLLHSFPNLEIVPPSEIAAKEAARLRAKYRLKTPDALIAATGLNVSANAVITNDRNWERLEPEGISVIVLDRFLTR
jgi:predicted nucleic acid-binding protein